MDLQTPSLMPSILLDSAAIPAGSDRAGRVAVCCCAALATCTDSEFDLRRSIRALREARPNPTPKLG